MNVIDQINNQFIFQNVELVKEDNENYYLNAIEEKEEYDWYYQIKVVKATNELYYKDSETPSVFFGDWYFATEIA